MPEIRYNAGFTKQDGADMVDGIRGHPPAGAAAVVRPGRLAALLRRAIFWPGRRTGWSRWPSARWSRNRPTATIPLVLFGPSGTGKSHLARGIAAAWKAPDRRHRVVSTTAVDFARELAEAIETQAVEEFRPSIARRRCWFLKTSAMLATRKSGKLSAQEEFIHTLDALLAEGRWVVVTASAAPAELPGILPALQSRLTAGLTIPLAPPGPETRLAVLQQLAALRNIPTAQSPCYRPSPKGLTGTVPELAGALLQLMMQAQLRQRSDRPGRRQAIFVVATASAGSRPCTRSPWPLPATSR